ncbi:MAG TPA: nuclear transport factor 2 family protein, partial [Candidatus Eisenbacteria bacterium]|nr:nuclear transport factor 2 family protein [Candidatus Eisenbacteria bacterium]
NQGRRETVFELFAPDGVLHEGGQQIRGPEEFCRSIYDQFLAQFSEFHFTPLLVLSEGDLAAIHWSAEFRHTETSKPLTLTGTTVVRIANGRFVEGWQNWDAAGLAAQLSA